MADNRQFGTPRAPQFGDKPPAGDTGHCGQCEAMLADALDGALSPADQALFDLHIAHCGPCAQLLADARRGAAWLEMLRDPRPEPPAALLESILAQTSGAVIGDLAPHSIDLPGALRPVPAPTYGSPAIFVPQYAAPGNVLPFRARAAAAVRGSSFAQLMLQPRLAMTAAMAFLSIALTLDLTGVRLQDLRASDLRPSSIKRDFYSANANVVRYYEGLRVVYELESRVHDLQSSDGDAPTPSAAPSTPASTPAQPAAQPAPGNPGTQNSGPHPQPRQRPAPNSGTSRREDAHRTLQLAAWLRRDDPTPQQASTALAIRAHQPVEGSTV